MNNSGVSGQLISVVIPIYNEQDNIERLYLAIHAELERTRGDFEIIFIDDGSTDRSAETVRRLNTKDVRVKLVSLSRNFGTQLAILAGLDHAAGAAVIVMDGDLQHPPELIPRLIAHWQEGFDVVYCVRTATAGAGLWKRVTSAGFRALLANLLGASMETTASDFRLLDRKVVDALVQMREHNRFFRSLSNWAGFRQVGIPFVAHRRYAGVTKHLPVKLVSLAMDAVVSSSTIPLRLCTFAGFVVSLGAIPYALWAIYVRLFTDIYVPGWAAIIVAVLSLGGIQLISLGILGEYVGRIYEEVKRRPAYFVQGRCGLDSQKQIRMEPIKSRLT